jgi:hypothetical protein
VNPIDAIDGANVQRYNESPVGSELPSGTADFELGQIVAFSRAYERFATGINQPPRDPRCRRKWDVNP